MQTKEERLAELEQRFSFPGSTMTLPEYQRLRDEIKQDPQGAAELTKAGDFTQERLIAAVSKTIASTTSSALRSRDARIKSLSARLETLEKSPQPDVSSLLSRLAACEARVSACTFLLPEESRMTLNSRAQSILTIDDRISALEKKAWK